jgi:hypothetical protein
MAASLPDIVPPGQNVGGITPEPGRVGWPVTKLIAVCSEDQLVLWMAIMCKNDETHFLNPDWL